ncbi:MAG: hypothetical protein E6Q69_03260 [Aquipseudomonas alcaligenes]|uniref:Uncharacterized protein n=1 Tax=Aquipseudomonas alcaligenes TaxID=43263 RepID=A0A5C7WCD8_AQUAC|nr:MAG: hypothetical protein E6Q69_03260 [Pseudomonas alcaligenes]
MPRVYSSKDAGLPAFYISPTASLQRFNNYKLILKACLVTGYGARLAAGWTLVDEGDQYLVLRNASGNYVTISSGYYQNSSNLGYHGTFRVYLHATYTGINSSGVPQGQGVVSGTSGAATLPVYFGSDAFYWNANTRWVMLADDRTFIFIQAPIYATASSVSGTQIDNQGGIGTLYVGDDLGGNHIAVGGFRGTTPNSAQLNLYFDRLAFTTLRNPVSGLLVDTTGINALLESAYESAFVYTSHTTNGQLTYLANSPISVMPSIEMGLVRWVAAGQPQPGLRGIRRDHLMARNYSNLTRRQIEGALTGSDYTGDTILNLTPLVEGSLYLPLLAHVGGRGAFIVTDNPVCW